jgi:hypothetical protein
MRHRETMKHFSADERMEILDEMGRQRTPADRAKVLKRYGVPRTTYLYWVRHRGKKVVLGRPPEIKRIVKEAMHEVLDERDGMK